MIRTLAASRLLTRFAVTRLATPTVILCYHDLRENDEPSSWLSVSRDDFARQLDWLSSFCHFLSPNDLLQAARLRPNRLNLLVTFDDGKPNLHRIAAPLLRARGIPALFLLSTWHVDTGEPFWFDRVVTPIQLARLEDLDLLGYGLRRYHFRRGDSAARWDDLQALLEDLKAPARDGAAENSAVLAEIARAAGLPDRLLHERLRPLDWKEAAELAADELFSIGSHGHRHAILTRLTDDALIEDLRVSRELLGRTLGIDADAVAYPNGDNDARVRAAAAKAGFRLGFVVRAGIASIEGDRLALPRVLVGGYDGLTLLRYKLNRALLQATLRPFHRSFGHGVRP
jgi:peptidoglycan/xylan/chitin deacetylase (PgdA/CDA1 family)